MIKDDKLLVMHRNKFGHEYYSLIGGGIDAGETPLQALYREVREETGLNIAPEPRLVYLESAGEPYGPQYIYLCGYEGGEPALQPTSDEHPINAMGTNTYTPMWLPLSELPQAPLLPSELKSRLITDLSTGFPEQPVTIEVSNVMH